jgi:hypothetical protein
MSFRRGKISSAASGFDGFHGLQSTGEFQADADAVFRQRGIILQNFPVRLTGGDCAADVSPTFATGGSF